MIHLPLLTAALALAATVFVSSTESADVARRRAIFWALVALVGTAVGALFGVVPVGELGVVTAFTPLSAALAVTLATLVLALIVGTPSAADPADRKPSSERVDAPFFGRLLAMGSVGTAFLLVREPMLLALVWPLTAAPLLAEVKGVARRRVIEHVAVASVLALAGTILASVDAPIVVAAGLLLAGILVREGIAPAHGLVVHAHRDAPIGVALLLTQPQLGLHLLAQLDPTALASMRVPVLTLALLTALGAAWFGLRAQTPRALLMHVTLATTAIAIAALTTSGLSSDAILLVLVVGTSLGAFGLALAVVEARGVSPTLSSATLTLGLVALSLPAGLVLIHASKAGWTLLPTLLAIGASVASAGLVVPLARVSTPPTCDPDVRVSWSEGSAMTGLALATTLLALHSDRFATWLG
jgi:hypothetical protein